MASPNADGGYQLEDTLSVFALPECPELVDGQVVPEAAHRRVGALLVHELAVLHHHALSPAGTGAMPPAEVSPGLARQCRHLARHLLAVGHFRQAPIASIELAQGLVAAHLRKGKSYEPWQSVLIAIFSQPFLGYGRIDGGKTRDDALAVGQILDAMRSALPAESLPRAFESVTANAACRRRAKNYLATIRRIAQPDPRSGSTKSGPGHPSPYGAAKGFAAAFKWSMPRDRHDVERARVGSPSMAR